MTEPVDWAARHEAAAIEADRRADEAAENGWMMGDVMGQEMAWRHRQEARRLRLPWWRRCFTREDAYAMSALAATRPTEET